MCLTKEQRAHILNEFLRTIEGISNKGYQWRVWIAGLGPEVDDYDETVCNFDDDGTGVVEEYKKFGLTERQYKIVKRFYDNFEKFDAREDRPYLPIEFIDN